MVRKYLIVVTLIVFASNWANASRCGRLLSVTKTGLFLTLILSGTTGEIRPDETFPIYTIVGGSMYPGLISGDRIAVDDIDRNFIRPGNRVVFILDIEAETPEYVIKRIIAIPGDWVEIKDGLVFVNDTPISEPYLQSGMTTLPLAFEGRRQVPQNHVFVLGDHRAGSVDSRHPAFLPNEAGFVPTPNILGTVILLKK